MESFQKAKIVRLKSAHGKYLTAEEDEESVTQDRNGSSRNAKWAIELAGDNNIIRLKSCYGKYLTASNQPFLLGMTGRNVLQTLPKLLDRSIEWEPVSEKGAAVKMRTRDGRFLRANGGLPPWRNTVTHDIPYRTATMESVLWEVHVVEIVVAEKAPPPEVLTWESTNDVSRQESIASFVSSSPKGSDGRVIYFHITDVNGQIDEGFEELCITFKGNGVNELTSMLEEELCTQGITVCVKSPLNGKLYPLRLHLPPNNATMHVVVVPPSSRVDRDWEKTEMPVPEKFRNLNSFAIDH